MAGINIHLKAGYADAAALRDEIVVMRGVLQQREALLAEMEGRPAPPPAAAGGAAPAPAASPELTALEAAVKAQGDKIREMKAAKASKEEITKEVKILQDLKAKSPAPVSAPPAAPTAPALAASPEVAALEAALKAQGDKIREMKAAKASKEEIGKEVKILQDLKAKVTAVAGAPAAPAPEEKKKEGGGGKKVKAPRQTQQSQRTFTFVKDLFGPMDMVNSSAQSGVKWTEVGDLVSDMADSEVAVRARVHAVRKVSGKLGFLTLRRTPATVQCVVSENSGLAKECVQWALSLSPESLVEITGKVTVPKAEIVSTSQKNVEITVTKIFLVSESEPVLPFQLADATTPVVDDDAVAGTSAAGAGAVHQDTRLNFRWLDMRTPTNHAIWTLQARICQYFREFLTHQKSFVEIHTPKLIPTASEGGANVFGMNYFGGKAFLAQSPQLYKQMALQGDLHGVFEIGSVFRAENSNTHRHLCEFVGLDVELTIKEHYYEVLDVAEALFAYMFNSLHKNDQHIIDIVKAQWPCDHFEHQIPADRIDALGIGIIDGEEKRPSKDKYGALIKNREVRGLRLAYPEGVRFLNTTLPEGEQMDPTDDINTANEIKLGKLIKERYGVDYYILDTFPIDVRPFYTMPHPGKKGFSNSYDMFMRGEEISSGAQRIHDVKLLQERAAALGVDLDPIQSYVDCFKLGAWPHGGFGVGMERVLMLFLGLKNIRACSLFPRDPKRCWP